MAIIVSNTSIQFGDFTLSEKADGFEFDGVIEHKGLCDARPSPLQGGGSVSGYTSGGGLVPGAATDDFDKFPFSSDTNATDVGELSQARYETTGHSSADNGYTAGGLCVPGSITTIDKFPFAADAPATDSAELTENTARGAGSSSGSHGYVNGHEGEDHIEKFSFATDTPASDVGELSQNRFTAGGHSSSENGYTSGGQNFPAPPTSIVDTIDKYPFAADGPATDVGELTQSRRLTIGSSSSTNGYTVGGYLPPTPFTRDTIDKFPFAADAPTTDVGELATCRHFQAGPSQASTTHGYSSGGAQSPGSGQTTQIEKFAFASDTNGTYIGALTQCVRSSAGQQV